MSSNYPPGQQPGMNEGQYGPPNNQDPYGQPGYGQPGYGQPSSGPVFEQMAAGGGGPMPPEAPRRGRKGLIIGLVAALAVLAGGGVWAWQAFISQGPQPAEALPKNTLAYVSVDLDPSGTQKIEALKTLRKFPAFKEDVGLDTDDDVRKKIFDTLQDSGTCTEIDYDDDVEPWLGDRAAAAVVDQGNEHPDPVLVIQVTNQGDAEDGLNKLVNCGNDASGESQNIGGYAFNGDWVVIAETKKIAERAVADAEKTSLEDDDDYQKWTKAAGDPGVMSFYAAPAAGEALSGLTDEIMGEFTDLAPTGNEEELRTALEDFEGGAGTVRFDGGNLEVEFATGHWNSASTKLLSGDGGDDVLSTLPDSTGVAIGAGFEEGWAAALLERAKPLIESESGMSYDEALAEIESETGLSVPDDIEVLLGESVVIALDGNFDPDQVEQLGPENFPIGAKIKGDTDRIEAVLDKIRAELGPDGDVIASTARDGHVVISPSQDYLEDLTETGDLGTNSTFRSVVPRAEDASAILYANFDANNWLIKTVESAGAESDIVDNVAVLRALGISSWTEGDEVHTLIKLTTE